jgi:hypothetical protein
MPFRSRSVTRRGVAHPRGVAHASPPDETWRPGLYDEADFDDVIDLIVSLSGAVPDSSPRIFQRAPLVAAAVVSLEPSDLPPRLLRPDDTRSPPSL